MSKSPLRSGNNQNSSEMLLSHSQTKYYLSLDYLTWNIGPPKLNENLLKLILKKFLYIGKTYFFVQKPSEVKINLFMKGYQGVSI